MTTRVWPMDSRVPDKAEQDAPAEPAGFLLLESDRTLARRLLQALQTPCKLFEDGTEALGYLLGHGVFGNRASFPLPEAILLDLEHPPHEGMELIKTLRLVPALKLIPLIVLKERFTAEDLQEAYLHGAVSCIEFPPDDASAARVAEGLRRYWLGCNLPPFRAARKSAASERSKRGP